LKAQKRRFSVETVDLTSNSAAAQPSLSMERPPSDAATEEEPVSADPGAGSVRPISFSTQAADAVHRPHDVSAAEGEAALGPTITKKPSRPVLKPMVAQTLNRVRVPPVAVLPRDCDGRWHKQYRRLTMRHLLSRSRSRSLGRRRWD
jgi:hypothetical protein